MSEVKLYVLGSPRLERNGQPLQLKRRRARALLIYLVMNGQQQSREQLATIFWPEYSASEARKDLRRTLSVLNKAVGPDILMTTREIAGLHPDAPLWVDAHQFRRLLTTYRDSNGKSEQEQLRRLVDAVELYQDDFLTGFGLSDSPDFDDWQFFQSEELRQLLIGALQQLVHLYSQRGELESAITYARRWLTLDTLQEFVHQQLMQLYASAGQWGAAQRQYEECVRILDEELGVPPDESTESLYTRITEQREVPTPLQIAPPKPAASGPVEISIRQLDVASALQITSLAPLHNLPTQQTSFIGRDKELAQIRQQLVNDLDCRLLTLVGPGGMGKTRLALRTASDLLDEFEQGVWFAPLASVDDPALLAPALADALQLPMLGSNDPQTQLFDFVREKKLLLILDNFEQVVDGAEFLAEVLAIAPHLKMLVTSRHRLNLVEEWVFEVEGLDSPQNGTVNQVVAYSAVQLFYERARRVHMTFSLEGEEQHIARVCRILGGQPLGIELAAGWVRTLPCEAIATEIQHNLAQLSTTLRNVPERHRSLRAVFEHSWRLLDANEQQVLSKLAVFRGGFDLESAASIAEATLPLLLSLTDQSFLHQTDGNRYELHEQVRQFAVEKLEQAHVVYRQHAQHYADFVSIRHDGLLKGNLSNIQAIGREIDNIRAGWEWGIAQADGEIVDQMLPSLASYYELRGWYQDGVKLVEHALDFLSSADASTGVEQLRLGRLYQWQGWFKHFLGQETEAVPALEESLALFRQVDVAQDIAWGLTWLADVHLALGEVEQSQLELQESLALFGRLKELYGQAFALGILGIVDARLDRDEEALEHLRGSATLLEQVGNQRQLAKVLKELGNFNMAWGNYEEAQRLYRQSSEISQDIGELSGVASCLSNLGLISTRIGDYEQAKQYNTDSLALFTQLGERRGITIALTNLGQVLHLQNDLQQAQEYLAMALTISNAIGHPFRIALASHFLGCVADALAETDARSYFAQAIQIAIDIQYYPMLLWYCPDLAVHLSRFGQHELAIEILSMAIHDMSGEKFYRDLAIKTVEEIAVDFDSEMVASAKMRGRLRDLSTTAAELLEILNV